MGCKYFGLMLRMILRSLQNPCHMSETILWTWEKTGFADGTNNEDKSEGMNSSRLSLRH